jgi:SagB-type dehydrogenase family enzyme
MSWIGRRGFLKLISMATISGIHLLSPARVLSALAKKKEGRMILPTPDFKGSLSVQEAIKSRRTNRSFSSRRIEIIDLSQLLYAAQGITEDGGHKRAAPSGGALYPLDVYGVVGAKGVEGLDAGVYRFVPPKHHIELVTGTDKRSDLAKASLHQMWVAEPPLSFVITAEYSRIESKYGERGRRYAMIEAGHVGQNIFLQAEALGLSAGIVGAFEDAHVIKVLGLPKKHEPLIIMPVGYRA